jgi:hypothetical protein
MIFSFSRLNLFESCPFRWYLTYIEKRETEMSLPLALGRAVHKAIEQKMKGDTDKDALLKGWKDVEYYDFNLTEYEELYRRANVVQGEANSPSVEVEKHFTLYLDGEGSPRVQGYIDVVRHIFGTVSFDDWKTNHQMYEPMDTMQLPLYAWALSQIYNVDQVTGTLFFLRFYKNNRKTFVFSKKEMEQARQWALKVAEEILAAKNDVENGHRRFEDCFPAKANSSCTNCPFATECIERYPKNIKGVFIT